MLVLSRWTGAPDYVVSGLTSTAVDITKLIKLHGKISN